MINFHYMELLRHKTVGTYILSSGKEVYNSSGVEISVWLSMDRRNACMVFRFYGTYHFCEC